MFFCWGGWGVGREGGKREGAWLGDYPKNSSSALILLLGEFSQYRASRPWSSPPFPQPGEVETEEVQTVVRRICHTSHVVRSNLTVERLALEGQLLQIEEGGKDS